MAGDTSRSETHRVGSGSNDDGVSELIRGHTASLTILKRGRMNLSEGATFSGLRGSRYTGSLDLGTRQNS